jgi:hypothetical protein
MTKLIKALLIVLAFAASFVCLSVFAGTPAENSTANTFNYKSPDDEVAVNIERGSGIVKFKLSMQNLGNYDHIIIERSVDNPGNFGQCKYITCADKKSTGGNMTTTDNYPYSADRGVYYRIKTVNKDGIERCYAAILLPPLEDTNNSFQAQTTNANTTANK